MSTDSTAAGTSNPGEGTGTAPASQGSGTAQAPATGAAQGSDPTTQASDLTALQAELAREKRAREAAEKKARDIEQATMTEQQRKDARLAELEAEQANWTMERQTLILRQAAFQAATAAGALYPDLVAQYVNPASVEWDKDGKPTNIGKVVADARQAYPALFRATPGSADGGAGAGAAPTGTNMNDLIRRGAGRA